MLRILFTVELYVNWLFRVCGGGEQNSDRNKFLPKLSWREVWPTTYGHTNSSWTYPWQNYLQVKKKKKKRITYKFVNAFSSHSPLFRFTWSFVSTECFALLVHLTNVYSSKSSSKVKLLYGDGPSGRPNIFTRLLWRWKERGIGVSVSYMMWENSTGHCQLWRWKVATCWGMWRATRS